jgi:hypothetical protein
MVIDTPYFHCFFCRSRFIADLEADQDGFIPSWKVTVCLRCLAENPAGLAADHPAVTRLAERGLILKPNAEGIVMWPSRGLLQDFRCRTAALR